MTVFKLACVQTNSGLEIVPNIAAIEALVRRARDEGADLIALPENVTMIDRRRRRLLGKAMPEESHPALPAFRNLASETGAWILAGSLTIRLTDEQVANRSFLFDANGEIVARYDKIHMFDVDLDTGETYRESSYVRSGGRAVLAPTPWGLLGMTVCYDLRFPQLYRTLAQAGASLLSVPAAFTAFTGRAHWHVLLCARAIETGCFVFAPAQCGTHEDGRETFGHSLIVAPWGEMLADGGEDVGIVTADIDTERVGKARGMVPSLDHDRPFDGPTPATVEKRAAGD